MNGGKQDLNAYLKNPDGDIIYRGDRKRNDSYRFKAQIPGEYSICFSNEFSTLAHKIVYVSWEMGYEINGGASDINKAWQIKHTAIMDSILQSIGNRFHTVEGNVLIALLSCFQITKPTVDYKRGSIDIMPRN